MPKVTDGNESEWDRERIIALLATSDRAVERAVTVLFARQTEYERASESTLNRNHRGYTALDADIFSSFAKQMEKGWHLSARQLAVCRKADRRGHMRIGRYHRQLLEIIEQGE